MGSYFDLLPNYTGPYISNGKFQKSVEFGDVKPKDQLDYFSRLHDSAYAKWNDKLHRTVADSIYNEQVKQLEGVLPEVARHAVLFGNQVIDSFSNLAHGYFDYGPFGILVGGLKNMYDLQNYIENSSSVKKEILQYYSTDPYDFGRKMNRTFRYRPNHDQQPGGILDDLPQPKPKPVPPSDPVAPAPNLGDKHDFDVAKLQARSATYNPGNGYGNLPANEVVTHDVPKSYRDFSLSSWLPKRRNKVYVGVGRRKRK